MLQRFLYNFNMVWLIWKSVTHRLEATSQLGWGAPVRRFTAALRVTPPWCSLQGKLSACLLKVSAKLGSEVLGNTYMWVGMAADRGINRSWRWVTLLRQEGRTRWPTEVPSNPHHSVILWTNNSWEAHKHPCCGISSPRDSGVEDSWKWWKRQSSTVWEANSRLNSLFDHRVSWRNRYEIHPSSHDIICTLPRHPPPTPTHRQTHMATRVPTARPAPGPSNTAEVKNVSD